MRFSLFRSAARMADKLTDAEIANELKKYGEQVKLPIDRKKRPLLLKKLNHHRAKERTASQPKKATSSRKKQQAEFSSEESETEENETSSPLGRMFGRGKRASTSSFYSNTDTIEISPSTFKDETKPRRNTRRSFVSQSQDNNSTSDYVRSKSDLYPDLSSISSSTETSKRRSFDRRQKDDTVDFSYEQDFTDSDPDDSSYEVVNKSVNTTFVCDNPDEEPTLHQTRTSPYRSTSNKKSGLAQNSVLVQRQKNKSTMNHTNDLPEEEPEEPLEDAFQTEEKVTETSSSYVSSVLVLLVAIFFLSISLTYVYLRRDYLFHADKELPKIPYSLQHEDKDSLLEVVKKISVYLHQQTLDPKRDVKKVSKSVVKVNLEKDKVIGKDEKGEEKFDMALYLILANPNWSLRLYDKKHYPIVYLGDDAKDKDVIKDVFWLEADRDKSFIERFWDSAYRIFIGFVLLMSCVVAGIIFLLILKFYNKTKEEEQKKVYNMVEQIIDIIKDNFEASESDSNVPAFMAIQHVRDQLLPIAKRKKLLPIWEKAVKFIEANESRIRVESQAIQGEEFLVWKWLPTISNGGKVWQGQAFGENNKSPMTLPYGPTPCLKIRNMFDADMEIEEDWEQNVKDAILEKCRGITGILHIHVDETSKEGCVYMKCSSCEVAYKVYKSLHGWWFDGRLVTVKYLRLEHYHNRFPDSVRVTKSLKPSNNKMSSMSQPYHRSTLEMT